MARRAGKLAANCWLPLFGICALACSVDQRDLQLGSGDDTLGAGASTNANVGVGGDPGAGGMSTVASNSRADGGAAGASPEPDPTGGSSTSPALPPLVNGCADLDTDMVADCTVTLVKNPSFKRDVTDWIAGDGAALAWDPRNALGDTPSGCALVTATGTTDIDGSAPFKASQCVPVPANQIVIAYANALIDAPTQAGDPAQAELEVSFFDAEGCAGQPSGQFFTPPSTAGTWATVQAGGLSGPAASSASLALVGLKPNRADKLDVCFDNVMVKAKAPSP